MELKGHIGRVGKVVRGRMFSVVLLVMVMASALGASMATPSSAEARVLGQGGWAKGPSYTTPFANCSYMNDWGVLRVSAAPPKIYAANLRSGWGNERQLVGYRAILRNYYTGAVVAVTPYSSLVWAYDNYPAQFTGWSALNASWRGRYVLDYHVQWFDSRSGTAGSVSGWRIHRFDSYIYYSGGVGPYGTLDSCLKYR